MQNENQDEQTLIVVAAVHGMKVLRLLPSLQHSAVEAV